MARKVVLLVYLLLLAVLGGYSLYAMAVVSGFGLLTMNIGWGSFVVNTYRYTSFAAILLLLGLAFAVTWRILMLRRRHAKKQRPQK